MNICLRLPVADTSHTADARRRTRALAVESGFNETDAEKVAIVVTEAATNLLKHGGGGEIFVGSTFPGLMRAEEPGTLASRAGRSEPALFEILVLDRGPGIEDVQACLTDGFSTSGTPGTGLGAISRLSSAFDIYSNPSAGTVLLARLTPQHNGPSRPVPIVEDPVQIAALWAPKPGEEACGDQWGFQVQRGRRTIVAADGLGHGVDASIAGKTAVEALYREADRAPADLLSDIHLSMRHTRGAAVAVAELDYERRLVRFAGLGNITAKICEGSGVTRQMVSLGGTAGAGARVFREFSYPWPEGAAVVLHSDGLSARWEITDYPGLLRHDPAVIAGVLFRDHSRGTDDSMVVVAR